MSAKRYLITTQSYRHEYATGADIPTQFGYLLESDLNSFSRLISIPTPTENPDGERVKTGLRGICEWKGNIYVASWNAVYLLDYRRFEIIDKISHPLMSNLHGIFVDQDGLWLTSTRIDSLLHFDHDHRFQKILTLPDTRLYPRKHRHTIDQTQDYRLRGMPHSGFAYFHINNVISYGDDCLLVTGRGKGADNGKVLLVDKDTFSYKVWIKNIYGPHDGALVTPQDFAVTETETSSIAIYDLSRRRGPRLRTRLHLPASEAKYWTRGLAVTPDGDFLVGRSVWKGDDRKASIIRLDAAGALQADHEISLPDYPECRIFQIIPSPDGQAADR